ncbi:MAG: hypothetical protein GY926_08845, partial [bacterium]|nr:hypothetical protein [bacterium]
MTTHLPSRALLRRLERYKKFVNHPALQKNPLVRKYKTQVNETATSSTVLPSYVAGVDINGDTLRVFTTTPVLCGPLVCQLCKADFLYDVDFAKHQDQEHGGLCEYRKRVLYLIEQNGCRAITAQEKRLMVQNFAHFQQFSRPGSKGNTFSRSPEVPRCEVACALCQQRDFIEYRHKLSLFGTPPPVCERTAADALASVLTKRDDVYYIQSPDRVHELLDVERYARRWPLIPAEELHASSVQHPGNELWRWLLHVRRVPTAGAPDSADTRPPCAGIGDETALIFACWDCLVDIAAKKPKMPFNACANDNWIGRERLHVREASPATKMLASLGRCCYKQIRLGRQGDPALQEKALTGNTIFFAQPTADVPSLELPPSLDALVDSLCVIYTRSLHDLSRAEWATVNRTEYMKIVRERRLQCPVFSNVVICDEREAESRLPAHGVPTQLTACLQEIDGSENAPVRLQGPASRAPDVEKHEDASSETEEDSACEPVHAATTAEEHLEAAEVSIAVDPVQDLPPVKMMQALRGTIDALQTHAAKLIRNEKQARIQDESGVLRPVIDEGGREALKPLILDVQSTVRGLDDTAQATIERAVAQAETRLTVCPAALAIPTGEPLDSFNARTYPACYVEWWFGDGAPGLQRDRPMLFEQVARRLINIEEHQYSLPSDAAPYKASGQSRFSNPEIIAVLGDVVRRMRLLKGTRAAIGRKGFTADLK